MRLSPGDRPFGAIAATLALIIALTIGSIGTWGSAGAQSATPDDAGEITVSHAQGEAVIPANPEVVLSFDLASVDTLDALGIEVTGLPKSNLSGALEKYSGDEYVDIGTLFEPDYEAVNAAQPDLIIVAGRSAAALPELSQIAPTIDLTPSGTDFIGDLTTTTTVLAEIFGKQDEAAAILAGINEQVAALQAGAAGAGSALVIMTSGGEVTALAPGGNRGGLIYNTLGFTPPIEDVAEATHGEAISFEFLLEANPDWLFVIDRDVAIGGEAGEAAAQVLDNELVHETTAWQNDQIIYLNPYNWYIVGSGLSTVQSMLDELEPVLAADE